MELFTPRIKSKNPIKRLKAVEKLVSYKHQTKIIEVLKNDKDSNVRIAALKKLDAEFGIDLFKEIIFNEKDTAIAALALEMLVKYANKYMSLIKTLIERNDKEIIEILIDNGFDVNNKIKKGLSPILLAIYEEKKDIIEILLEHGAIIEVDELNLKELKLDFIEYPLVLKSIIKNLAITRSRDIDAKEVIDIIPNNSNITSILFKDFKEFLDDSFLNKLKNKGYNEKQKISKIIKYLINTIREKEDKRIEFEFLNYHADKKIESTLDQLLDELRTCASQTWQAMSAPGNQFSYGMSGQQVQLNNFGFNRIPRIKYNLEDLEPSASWLLIQRTSKYDHTSNEYHKAILGLQLIFESKGGLGNPYFSMKYWVEKYIDNK